jgi:hypothetical protein
MEREDLVKLRKIIHESLRVQKGGADAVEYIDVSNALSDASARQNHAVFGRRGCGKTLLLHKTRQALPSEIKAVYLNCEDFKRHSFPNVLIEILDALFRELQKHFKGWFGKKKRSADLIAQIRAELNRLRSQEDHQQTQFRVADRSGQKASGSLAMKAPAQGAEISANLGANQWSDTEVEQKYSRNQDKLRDLDMLLPRLKEKLGEIFQLSSTVKSVYLEIDDFYHLSRPDQPFVMDYIHRLCKDLPLYFKVATLRHATTLYADRKGQPIGAQERHDYQPINVDFTFADFRQTADQNRAILRAFGQSVDVDETEINELFKGQGFDRLVMAGGGVPRDFLSLFIEIVEKVQPPKGDGRIGKDDVRTLSRAVFERRIEELKQDSEGQEQDILLRGIYILREFCEARQTNVLLMSEAVLQKNDRIRSLLYRLLDYRIVHTAGSALTHKSQPGTFHAFMIDIGCYAHLRKLQGKFEEIDPSDHKAKERMRSSGAILTEAEFSELWNSAPPEDIEASIRAQDDNGD